MQTELRPEINTLIEKGRMTRPTALFVQEQDSADADALIGLMRQLKFSLQSQREMVEWLQDIQKRDNLPVRDILAKIEYASLVNDSALNGPQKSDLFRDRLHALRFPQVAAFLEGLKERQAKIKLPKGVKLTAVSPLEEGECRLEIAFQSGEELKAILADLNKMTVGDAFREWNAFLENGGLQIGPDKIESNAETR